MWDKISALDCIFFCQLIVTGEEGEENYKEYFFFLIGQFLNTQKLSRWIVFFQIEKIAELSD